MRIIKTSLKGLVVIEPQVFRDSRGYFLESFQAARFHEHGIPDFVQDNFSRSKRGVLRGLHYQLPHAQGKLIGVTRGKVWDVSVDIRLGSPTFGQWLAFELSDENQLQVYVPPGFAHGFCVLSEEADFYYKCTDYYNPTTEKGIAWNDPELKISWPVQEPILSAKDQHYLPLKNIAAENFFKFDGHA